MVIVWTFAPVVSTFHTPLSKVLPLCPTSLPTHPASLQSWIWELQVWEMVAEPLVIMVLFHSSSVCSLGLLPDMTSK